MGLKNSVPTPFQSLNLIPYLGTALVPYIKSISERLRAENLLVINSVSRPVEPSPDPIIGILELSNTVISNGTNPSGLLLLLAKNKEAHHPAVPPPTKTMFI
jgi:hypothetical protein